MFEMRFKQALKYAKYIFKKTMFAEIKQKGKNCSTIILLTLDRR